MLRATLVFDSRTFKLLLAPLTPPFLFPQSPKLNCHNNTLCHTGPFILYQAWFRLPSHNSSVQSVQSVQLESHIHTMYLMDIQMHRLSISLSCIQDHPLIRIVLEITLIVKHSSIHCIRSMGPLIRHLRYIPQRQLSTVPIASNNSRVYSSGWWPSMPYRHECGGCVVEFNGWHSARHQKLAWAREDISPARYFRWRRRRLMVFMTFKVRISMRFLGRYILKFWHNRMLCVLRKDFNWSSFCDQNTAARASWTVRGLHWRVTGAFCFALSMTLFLKNIWRGSVIW